MFKVYTASDFLYDLQSHIPNCNYTVELYVSEYDLLSISDILLELMGRKVNITVVISALTEKKSLRVVNLFNRMIQLGSNIYWSTDTQLYENDVHFAILDKKMGIKKTDFYTGEGNQSMLVFLNQLFDSNRTKAKEIELLTGEITITFNADKTFVKRNSGVVLSWEVKNAHQISLVGHQEGLDAIGKTSILVRKDTLFKLRANNKDRTVEKQLIVKVIKNKSIELTLEAYDPYLKEFVVLKSINEKRLEYLAFEKQKIRLSWICENMGALSEKLLGALPLEGEHEFILSHIFKFDFKFESIYGSNHTSIKISPVEDKSASQKQPEESSSLFSRFFRRKKNKI